MKNKQLRIRISEKMKANLLAIKPRDETMNSFINRILTDYIYDCNLKNTISEDMQKTVDNSLIKLRKEIMSDIKFLLLDYETSEGEIDE